ncbi:MAG: hypothetical protein FWD42_01740 [Solirubrobacterales bacterium]|nr:hypothetical protein [Solirubrobacterales bacterium]
MSFALLILLAPLVLAAMGALVGRARAKRNRARTLLEREISQAGRPRGSVGEVLPFGERR